MSKNTDLSLMSFCDKKDHISNPRCVSFSQKHIFMVI